MAKAHIKKFDFWALFYIWIELRATAQLRCGFLEGTLDSISIHGHFNGFSKFKFSAILIEVRHCNNHPVSTETCSTSFQSSKVLHVNGEARPTIYVELWTPNQTYVKIFVRHYLLNENFHVKSGIRTAALTIIVQDDRKIYISRPFDNSFWINLSSAFKSIMVKTLKWFCFSFPKFCLY